jgi:hypothetical protein
VTGPALREDTVAHGDKNGGETWGEDGYGSCVCACAFDGIECRKLEAAEGLELQLLLMFLVILEPGPVPGTDP